jgi:hypothetical protein
MYIIFNNYLSFHSCLQSGGREAQVGCKKLLESFTATRVFGHIQESFFIVMIGHGRDFYVMGSIVDSGKNRILSGIFLTNTL